MTERLVEIGDSNRAQQLSRPGQDVSLESPDALRGRTASGSAGSESVSKVDWRKVADQIKQGQTWWGVGDGLKTASGSVGHNAVKDVGHFFGKKFKPWEAVKIADKIGKIAKVGGFAIQVGLAGYEVWKDERTVRAAQIESERQHAAFVTEIMGHADKIAADARLQLSATIDPPIDAFIATIQAAQAEVLGADRARRLRPRTKRDCIRS